MRILFASFEAAPFFKTGGLGDVAGSLPVALAKVGVTTSLVLPGYTFLKLPSKTESMGSFRVIFNHKEETVHLRKMDYINGISLYILYHPFLSKIEHGKNKILNIANFAFFSKAVATMLLLNNNNLYGQFDLVHLHDWHTASVAYFLSLMDKQFKRPTIVTIHNLMYQGKIKKENLASLIGAEINDPSYQSLLELGIQFSDFVTTVSPTYAKEIVKTRYGMNLGKLLYGKRDRITGILNGIDYQVWNSQKDDFIYNKYSIENLKIGKTANKTGLQKELKLPVSEITPLISFIGRLDIRQKGIGLILQALRDFLKMNELQFVLLGTGGPKTVRLISNLVKEFPNRFVFINKFGNALSHKIYAASDIILVPSKFEPCGLVQMIAMRYGTLPLVRKTGGLADTVKDGINGFVFERYSATELGRTLRLALKLFKENPEKIALMRFNAMREDFSWDNSAKKYKKLYQKLIKE